MNAVSLFSEYMGNGLLLIFYLAATVYLYLTETRRIYRLVFVYLPAMILLFFFNPLFYQMFYQLLEGEIYYRILWLLPVSMGIGFTVVSILSRLQGIRRGIFITLSIVLLSMGGSFMFSNPFFSKAENPYHVPQTVVELCDALRVEGREVMVAMPMEFVNYVRQYDATICMPYGRTADLYYDELGYLLEQEELEVSEIVEKARQRSCHYLVLAQSKKNHIEFLDYEYETFLVINGYVVYKDTTQYFGL